MADDARQTPSDLSNPGGDMDFFQLLSLIEKGDARFGRSGGPEREPARLGQSPRLSFAASDVANVTMPRDDETSVQVAVNIMGLLGPEGPMPLHMTRWVMERLSNRWFAGDDAAALSDTSFLDLVNIVQHRMLALYWRAWADARPAVQVGRDADNRIAVTLSALAGIGLPGTVTGEDAIDAPKRNHATSLAQEQQGPERLCAYLETILNARVTLREFKGHWLDIPIPLQSRLGTVHSGLGSGAVVGARSFERLSRIELRVGPLRLNAFTALLTDHALWQRLCHAITFALGQELDVDLRLILCADEVPTARLGASQLGRTAWLRATPGGDADDLCFAAITSPQAELRRAA